jgi:feruloyl esterase
MRPVWIFKTLGSLIITVKAVYLADKCSSISLPSFDGFEIISSSAVALINTTVSPDYPPLSICNLSVTITHPGAGDVVISEVWLPLYDWNGRFVATGGGGYAYGWEYSLPASAAQNYATAFSDGGLSLNNTIDPSTGAWLLEEPGTVNWDLITNFAYRSLHDMTEIAKSAIRDFYGNDPTYSYYTGCSTGGRMGYFSAHYYPEDFDGILANAPALESDKLSVGFQWPMAVMDDVAGVPECVLEAYRKAFIAACDPLDGVTDGLITKPELCNFDTHGLVGSVIQCPEGNQTITSGMAEAIFEITRGPQTPDNQFLWYGIVPGTPYDKIVVTTTDGNMTSVFPAPLGVPWAQYALAKSTNFTLTNLTRAGFDELFNQSVTEYDPLFGSDGLSLTGFQQGGGKLLTWHGLADSYITYQSTTHYRDGLKRKMGVTDDQIDEFYRLFLAPGADHCSGGYGPVPTDPFDSLVAWVENGVAPQTLDASVTTEANTTFSRNLCLYPQQQLYNGGDVLDANSFTCG